MKSNMRDRAFVRLGLGLLVLGQGIVGIWASCFPVSFFGDFPGSGHWVAIDGPYNEHLVRDFGALSLAIAVVGLFAFIVLSLPLVRAAAAAVLVSGVPHLVYHLRHLDRTASGDRIGSISSLALGPLFALAMLWVTRSGHQRGATMPASMTRSSPSRGLLHGWLTSHVRGESPRVDGNGAQDVPTGVQA